MAKKKELKAVTIEEPVDPDLWHAHTPETVKPIETPKVKAQTNIKVWTEEELAVLPRDKFLKIEADIRDGKARVVQK